MNNPNTLDFTPKPWTGDSASMDKLIGETFKAQREAAERPRNYIGASIIGNPCKRAIYYDFRKLPRDPGKGFSGRTHRIFQRGHDTEARMIEYLRTAGFEIVTEKPGGGQIGFKTAIDKATGEALFAGHIDGVLTRWSEPTGGSLDPSLISWAAQLKLPALWECKSLGAKAWKECAEKGIKIAKPIYYAQVQLYMAYLGLGQNPAIFTAMNADTCEIFCERIEYDQSVAHALVEKAAQVIAAGSPSDLPRAGKEPSDFVCKWCDWSERCWSEVEEVKPLPSRPSWL